MRQRLDFVKKVNSKMENMSKISTHPADGTAAGDVFENEAGDGVTRIMLFKIDGGPR